MSRSAGLQHPLRRLLCVSTSQQTDPLIGRLVDGRYRVRARIARGGMATVYVATDLRLERRVALKVMHGHLSDDTVFQSRFIQEARSAARLADPNVVNVFDQGQDGDMAYLVMEYLPGITLRELLREQKRLTIPQTITIMDAVLSGLTAAHRAGIVHRDVKPENVLLAEDGRIKIGDFGLARATTANTATGQMLLGTIAYLAPELVTRGTADARSDIYALGIMLYEMLVGEQPYKGEQPMQIAYQHATESVPRPSVKNPGVPESLDELVLWATEREPDDRPTDAKVMLDRLREIEKDLAVFPQVVRTAPLGLIVADDGLAGTAPISSASGSTSGELTRVLPGSFTPPTVTSEADNATTLRQLTKKRRVRGLWLVTIAVLLAALTGGAGWWFGSGPGSLVAIGGFTGSSFAEAQQELAAHTLVAKKAEASSLTVAKGKVIRTDPATGTRVDRDSEVTVVVSTGPASHKLSALAGLAAGDVKSQLTKIHITSKKAGTSFTDAPADQVIAVSIARPGGDPVDCSDGCTAYEGSAATYDVSLGPMPKVIGLSQKDAASTLDNVGLTSTVVKKYSTTANEGTVIDFHARDGGGSWRPGDNVTLVVSKGPELLTVPNVIGMTRDEAKRALDAEGFKGTSDDRAWPDPFTKVTAQNPGAESLQPRGAEIQLEINWGL